MPPGRNCILLPLKWPNRIWRFEGRNGQGPTLVDISNSSEDPPDPMASAFCTRCGAAIPTGSGACPSCGAPVPAVPAPTDEWQAAGSASESPPASSGPPAELPLSVRLGIQNTRQFWIRHTINAPKRSYQVVSNSGVTLFNVGEAVDAERQANWHRARKRPAGVAIGPVHFGGPSHPNSPPARVYEWGLDDFAGNLRAELTMREGLGPVHAQLSSVGGQPILSVELEFLLRRVKATAKGPDGALELEMRGNTHDPSFALLDPTGALVASVQNDKVAGHTSHRVDLTGPVDPIHAIVLVVVIDAFSGAK